MGFAVEDRPIRPLTAEEVLRMVEAGILSEDEPVELLHGALTAVARRAPRTRRSNTGSSPGCGPG